MANSPAALAIAEPASAIQASAQRRVSNASIENPTPKTSASQANTRDGNANAAAPAPWLLNSTSHPRTAPVCGRMNDPSSTNTRIATTKPLGPGSISRATRRSAASISVRRASKSVCSFFIGHIQGVRRGSTAGPTPGMPRPMPRGRCPAACASPARVRRWVRMPGVGDEVVRRGLGDHRGDDVAGPHLLSSEVKCTRRPSRARPVMRAVRVSLRPSPVATSNSTVWPISARLPSSEICSCSSTSRS